VLVDLLRSLDLASFVRVAADLENIRLIMEPLQPQAEQVVEVMAAIKTEQAAVPVL
jgi:hypothetical protein